MYCVLALLLFYNIETNPYASFFESSPLRGSQRFLVSLIALKPQVSKLSDSPKVAAEGGCLMYSPTLSAFSLMCSISIAEYQAAG